MTVHLRTPGELIASIPALLGFEPHESIVVVGIGARGRVAPIVRVDRADCLIREVAASIAAAIAGHVGRARAESVVMVSFRQGAAGLRCEALDALRALVEQHIEVVDGWVTSMGRFRSPDCADQRCCPDAGRPVPHVASGLAGDASSQYSSSRDHVKVRESAPAPRRKAARAAFERAWRARERALGNTHASGSDEKGMVARADAAIRWRAARLEAWRRAVGAAIGGVLPSDPDTGKLAAGLWDLAVRDAAVVDMVPGRLEVAEALCADPGAPGVREALSVMINQHDGKRPDPATVRGIVTLADHIAWVCGDRAAPALTLAGLALWWSGDDMAAEAAIATALSQHPGYRLAELVASALEAHMPPGWLAVA